ncbi:MAG TPA: M17 family peptidase N-terminal domain-containing protein [Streptosporangiaceae bacterium]
MASIEFAASLAGPAQAQADVLVLPCFTGPAAGPGVAEISQVLGIDLLGQLRGPGAGHAFSGRAGDVFETLTLGRLPAPRLLLVGLGDPAAVGPAAIRQAVMMAAARISTAATIATTIPGAGAAGRTAPSGTMPGGTMPGGAVPGGAVPGSAISDSPISEYPVSASPASDGAAGGVRAAASAFAEGLLLGAYQFRRYKRQPLDEAAPGPAALRQVTVLTSAGDQAAVSAGLRHGAVIGEATNWVRDLVTTPARDLTPADMVDVAQQLAAGAGLKFSVLDAADLEEGGFGGILGVGQGSVNRPKLVELAYRGGGDGPVVALTGKGITFDSGGLTLKRTSEIEWMKTDMAGAATIMAVLRAAAEFSLPVSIDAALPFAENMPGGAAIRPGDVISHRGGRTSEVVDTDCEGRLIVADALAYLAERAPAALIDVATLTDAAGLGGELFAAMGNDQALASAVLAAGQAAGDPGWQLPLPPGYRRYLESAVADIRNLPRGVPDSTVMAGLYLSAFPGQVPWVHIDNGSTAYLEQATDCWPEGATGSPARALVRWLEESG